MKTRKVSTTSKPVTRYVKLKAHLTGVKSFGAITRVTVEDKGTHYEFFGDSRMIQDAIEGMERNHPVTINYNRTKPDEWYIERV
jgi:hypothetical protein